MSIEQLVAEIMSAAERMAYVYAAQYTFAAVPAQAEHEELERVVRAALAKVAA